SSTSRLTGHWPGPLRYCIRDQHRCPASCLESTQSAGRCSRGTNVKLLDATIQEHTCSLARSTLCCASHDTPSQHTVCCREQRGIITQRRFSHQRARRNTTSSRRNRSRYSGHTPPG